MSVRVQGVIALAVLAIGCGGQSKSDAVVTPWDGPEQNLAVVREFLRAADRSPK